MKILTVVQNLEKGGTQRAAQNFCEAYRELGHDSRMLAMYSAGPRMLELIEAGVTVWVMLATGLDEIAAWNPDVIHLHSHGLKPADLHRLLAKLPRARLFETNVFSIPTEVEKKLVLSFQLSKWCSFLYHCRRGEASKNVVIPNPVKSSTMFKPNPDDVARFKKRWGIPPDHFVIGRIGQAFTRKWSESLLTLFERFVDEVNPKAHLLLCNPSQEMVTAITSNPRIQSRTTIIDSIIGDEQLRLFYGATDVMVHIANVGESFGMVLAEALLCETPVLTLNTPWADNAQGEVVSGQGPEVAANDPEELYGFLKRLYDDPQRRMLLGKQGRRYILEHFDMLIVAERAAAAMERPEPHRLDMRELYQYTHNDAIARILMRLMYWLRSVRVGFWAGQVFLWRAGFSRAKRRAISRM